MPRNYAYSLGSERIRDARQNLTPAQAREMNLLDEKQSREWRNFWIRVLKTRGVSNVQIAAEFGLSESTVRHVLKGG